MRANKSSIRTDSDQFQSGDHYVVLGVEETATSEEIKIAFRKLALQHHPDKNPDDAPNATQIFASIQRAYEILSDEQERAWYDRQKPFRTSYPVPDTEPDDATSRMPGHYFTSSSTTNWTYHSARASTETKSESSSKDYYRPGSGPGGLSTDDIRNFMIPILSDALDMYSDSSMGMFTMYRKVFQLIVQDERDHGDPTAEFPSFGFSDTPWTAKCGHVSVSPFYDVWTTFQTSKDFSWIEVAQVNESESRKKKKKARGANMKAREAAKIEYNEIVQQLAELLKEHDPRYVFRVRKTNGRGICMCARCSMIYLSYMRGRGSRPF